ncbi:MAG: TonB-dependent receptor [Pseudomonadota bacterium]
MTYRSALLGAVSLSLGLSVPLASNAAAQTTNEAAIPIEQSTAESDQLDAIIVTGTRFETPLDQLGQSVTVITAEAIEARQQIQVFDTLALVPGVQTSRSGPIGTTSTVFLRGAPSNTTLVVQDGIVLNNLAATSGGFNFANFDTSDVERIEVIRGAQSTIYGSDAIGGVVNIITRSGAEGLGGSASIEGGSFGTFRGHATILGGTDRLNGRVTVGGVRSGGFSAQSDNDEDDGFENITISSRGAFKPIESLTLDGVIRYSDSELDFDGFPTDFATSNTEELNLAAFATHEALGGRLSNRFGITFSTLDSINLNDEGGDEGDGIPSEVTFLQDGERLSYEYQGSFEATDWLDVIVGAEREEAEASVPVAFVDFAEEVNQTSGYGLARVRPTDWIDLTAGVRHDANSQFGDSTTANAAGNVRIEQTGTILRGSYSEGFRAPSPGQLGANANNLDAILDAALDPALDPETSTGWDIGVQQTIPIFDTVLSVAYFQSDIDNLISFASVGPTFAPAFFNVDEVEIEGVEVTLSVSPFDGLQFEANYTYLEAVDAATGIQLDNRPENRATFDVSWAATDKLNVGAQLIVNGDETESFGDPLDDFVLLNLRADYALTDIITLFARIDNVTDTDYEDNSGFNAPNISAFGGIRARF